MSWYCYWEAEAICEKNRYCGDCALQPADEDKPNGKKEPVRIGWDKSEYGVWPECPACGEMPYSTERCTFCGQRFIQDDPQLREYAEPPEEVVLNCPRCGGKNTLRGRRARSNGHFHGSCEKCGAIVME